MIPDSQVNYFKYAIFEINQAIASHECAARHSVNAVDKAWHSEQLKTLHRAVGYIKQGIGDEDESTDTRETQEGT